MKAKDFDKFFRDKVNSMEGSPPGSNWNKSRTWEKLNEKQEKKPSGVWYKYAAASFTLFIIKTQKIVASATYTAKAIALVSTIAVVSTTVYVTTNNSSETNNEDAQTVEQKILAENQTIKDKVEDKEEPIEDIIEDPVVEENIEPEYRVEPPVNNQTPVIEEGEPIEIEMVESEGNGSLGDGAYGDPSIEMVPDNRNETKIASLEVNDILFKKNSVEIDPSSISELNFLLEILRGNPDVKALIIGYTDDKEKKKSAESLSIDRGFIVWKYLIEQGIDRKRVSYLGYGNQTKYSSKTEEGRALNRRVEIMLSK